MLVGGLLTPVVQNSFHILNPNPNCAILIMLPSSLVYSELNDCLHSNVCLSICLSALSDYYMDSEIHSTLDH